MGVHVMALTLSGGLPLFSRQIGNSQPLPFSLIASLNGVHMFCNSQQSGLRSTCTQDSTVVWKDYEDSITLIVAASTTSEAALSELMNCIFNTIVLTVGLEEVRGLQTRNIERLKRELRSCFPLMDKILDAVDLGDRNVVPTDFMSMVETVICSDSLSLKNCLGVFAECVESLFACLMLNSCIVVATGGWWELMPEERKLLALLVDSSSTDCTSIDVPVFLPCKSPTVPFRLVAVCLISGVWVAALCGPSPALSAVEQFCAKVWRPAIDLVRSVQSAPRFLPQGLQQNHHCIIGLLLVQCTLQKYILNRSQSANRKEAGDVLRTFYHQAASLLVPPKNNAASSDTRGLETYWCSEYHKLHALYEKDNLLCVLYTSALPNSTMRLVTRQTLQTLLSDKQLCW
ncbi:hypothetical protein LSTR_LSTR008403 [Laodelphax striatellus]|uniref:FUZ/MON1/HPS1 first Longin domain-containing protein n=1 Tax=Laodelphax striatellus TaxID=195883 RepID=A0A482XV41_LAOST|nr:hypothetical protein LSTR_LSTR008403 [Laodelphax striatellus]